MRKNSLKYTLIPLLFLFLQSCFVAKNYERPEVIEEKSYRTDEVPQDSSTMADISWRELFKDPILVGHIDTALANNIDIRIALENIKAAEAYYKQGKASFFPSIGAGGTVTHQELSNNSQFGSIFNGSITQYELTGNLSWEADIWGKIRSRKRAFQATYLQSLAAHKAVKTALIANVASAYFQLLALDEQKRIAEETIETRKSSLETTEALKEAGILSEVGVKQTEAQLYFAQALLVDIELNIKLLENTFSLLLGEAPHDIQRGEINKQLAPVEPEIGYPVQLLRNRPDVIAAEYNLIQAFEMSNAAKSNFYPSLSITATGGLQSLQLDQLLSMNSLFANIIGSIAQPIFNQRQIRTQYEVSLTEQEKALLNFRWAVLEASKEVSDALYTYDAALEKITIKEKEFQANTTAADYSEELLNNGFANYLEVLTARENALNSELNLVNAELMRLNSLVEIYRSLGGGWQ